MRWMVTINEGIMSLEEIKSVVFFACSEHCLANVRVKDGKILEQFFHNTKDSPGRKKRHTVFRFCMRARAAAEMMDHLQRLNYPLKRVGAKGENKWQGVTWEEVLDVNT